ncbi:inter-alpha-trypsin inhibitor heavy chain H3-like [Amphiura filiformis]|uniref:inter-alpha-trypsin inhibitor heavy chain H3-like n=1 Tax=Amphiura filiformis TaxID=82378 RepID=UPI003B21D4BB
MGLLLRLTWAVVITFLLGTEKVVGFPKQPVFITQIEDQLLEREERDLSTGDYEYGSGISDNGFNSTEEPKLTEPWIPPPAKIGSLHILSTTTARFTNTSVTSKLVNRAPVAQETEVTVRLPDEAFITELLIEVDGKIYRSIVETKQKAQKIYDTARERGQTASQVKQTSEKHNEFSVSINIAAMSEVKCTLIYQQLLLRKKGFFTNKISIRPNQVIPDLKVNVYITEPQGLKEVTYWLEKEGNELKQEQQASITSSQKAHIQFQPSKEEQLAQSEHGIVGDFVIKYDVVHPISGGKIEVVNGYFVHHFSPEGFPPAMKHVVFVIDVSGSMSGTKIQQTRKAMRTILDQLREDDTFNIVTFSSDVTTWQSEKMVPVTPDTIKQATNFVSGLEAYGGTNFYGGLQHGVSLLDTFHNSTNNAYVEKSLSMIIILSDGQPTSGKIQNSELIKEKSKEAIKGRYTLFTLGFGSNVDDTFLEKLAGQNRGVYRKIYVDSDSSLQLAGFFDDVATPLLLNIEFNYPSDVIDNNIITQTDFPTYFKGSEIVVAGKLANGINEVTAEVIMTTTEDGVLGTLVKGNVQLTETTMLSHHIVGNFTQRLWAYLTIKELLRKRLISDNSEDKEQFKSRALELSLKYHFVTPLTSLVVVKPDGTNATTGEKPTPRDESFERSSPVSNLMRIPAAITHRGYQGPQGPGLGRSHYLGSTHHMGLSPPLPPMPPILSVDSDPHFVLHPPNGNISLCFNIMGKPGHIYSLIKDPELGLNINARVQSATPHPELLKRHQVATSDLAKRTIFDQMAITTPSRSILVTSSSVTINNLAVPWTSDWSIVNGNFSIDIREGKYLYVKMKEDIELIVMLHAINAHHSGKSDYLGLYVEKGDGFSQQVHGMIGQFQRKKVHLYRESIRVDTNQDKTAILRVNDRTVKVLHASRDVLLTGAIQTCWFASNNGYGMIDGEYTDYLQDTLFVNI